MKGFRALWVLILISGIHCQQTPVVLTTWNFVGATQSAMTTLSKPENSALDAVETGCNYCENNPNECDFSVGYGGSPNDQGETTLDAMIMWAPTMQLGSVGCLKRIRNAISVARKVMELTTHSILVGEDATSFAVHVGFTEQSLATEQSLNQYQSWVQTNCTPNYWTNQTYAQCPDQDSSSGSDAQAGALGKLNHDTIGMVAIDQLGRMACGTSTNGLKFKIHGRVGDSPIPGAGAYCVQDIGGAAATGDGDVMVRFLLSFRAVEEMRYGASPQTAAENAVNSILKFYPTTSAAIVVLSATGEIGAASINTSYWSYNYQRAGDDSPVVVYPYASN